MRRPLDFWLLAYCAALALLLLMGALMFTRALDVAATWASTGIPGNAQPISGWLVTALLAAPLMSTYLINIAISHMEGRTRFKLYLGWCVTFLALILAVCVVPVTVVAQASHVSGSWWDKISKATDSTLGIMAVVVFLSNWLDDAMSRPRRSRPARSTFQRS